MALRARPDGAPGWMHVLTPAGRVRDDRRDLYDHAFVLLMFAALLRIDADPLLRDRLTIVLDEVNDLFRGGHADAAAGGLPRRLAPHMHLFEAYLALYEATTEPRFLARAEELFELFRTRFFDEPVAVVREFFAEDWSLLPGAASAVVEPGHLAAWVWLLRRYQRVSGSPVDRLCAVLLARAHSLGLAADGFLVDEVQLDTDERTDRRRLWVQSEYLKAILVQAASADPEGLWPLAAALSDGLFTTYLADVPPGAWRDRFTSREGHLAVDHIPASTFYHLIGVVAELQQ